jgi:hypothetical protein
LDTQVRPRLSAQRLAGDLINEGRRAAIDGNARDTNPYGLDELLEELAALEHEQWAHWTKHMLNVLLPLMLPEPPEGVLPDFDGLARAKDAWERWYRQISTKYEDLSEAERESDREWARNALQIIHRHVDADLSRESCSEMEPEDG